jgi:hypothetical protein
VCWAGSANNPPGWAPCSLRDAGRSGSHRTVLIVGVVRNELIQAAWDGPLDEPLLLEHAQEGREAVGRHRAAGGIGCGGDDGVLDGGGIGGRGGGELVGELLELLEHAQEGREAV